MERRELLKMIALLTGGVVIGGDIFLSGCKTAAKKEAGFTPENIALLDEVGETIIPTTDTPGAKATKIGAFMQTMVTDCYTQAEQDVFYAGLSQLDEACEKANGKSFMDCTAEQRKSFLLTLEKEAKDYNIQRDDKDKISRENARKTNSPDFVGSPSHYYSMIKQLTLLGYFTSEIGSKQALRWVPVPGKYIGDYPYKKGDKAWAI
jgi:Gluconate 2-dehydrogenase subunit 3